MLTGLSAINLELSSRCDKQVHCSFCGHQKKEINTSLIYGDMTLLMLEDIRNELSPGVDIYFHRSGEPTAYPFLKSALDLFKGFLTTIVTHGETLGDLADSIIGRCTTVTVSAFRGDKDDDKQYQSVKTFLKRKGIQSPQVFVKWVGDEDAERRLDFEILGATIIRRLIHVPHGTFKHAHQKPTIPENGVCWDVLHHPSIDWQGNVYLCNRLDPKQELWIGNLNEQSLDAIWNGPVRQLAVGHHMKGQRERANARCADCDYYGIPTERS